MKTLEIDFNPSGDVFNVFTKAILPNTLSSDLLKHDEIGNELYSNFIEKHLNGNLSVWKPVKRCNLKTFGSMRKSFKSVINNKEVHLKEEKNLMAKFLITARKQPQLELEECLGNYEFCVVPKSLLSADGQLLACNDKLKLIPLIEELADSTLPTNSVKERDDSCIIIDGMAVVNKIVKDNLMKTCEV